MRAKIYGSNLNISYIYDKKDSRFGWYDHFVKIADLYASRFDTKSMPSCTSMYVDVSWYQDDCVDGTFSILVGDPARGLFNSVHDQLDLKDDSWVGATSDNFQIVALHNVDTHEYIAFVG